MPLFQRTKDKTTQYRKHECGQFVYYFTRRCNKRLMEQGRVLLERGYALAYDI